MLYDNRLQRGDIARVAGLNIEEGDDLATAVLISLFTERRLPAGLTVDPNAQSKGGWWGDTFNAGDQIGSLLWTLRREVASSANLSKARDYIVDALRWMLDDGVAKKVEATTGRGSNPEILSFKVSIERPVGGRWQASWEIPFNEL